MGFATLGSLLTRHREPSFIAPSASATEAVRRLQHDDTHAIVIMRDAPPVCIVSDRRIVDSLVSKRGDPDAITALDLCEPIESFERTTLLDVAWNRIKARAMPWVAIRDGKRVIALVSRTQVLEWILHLQEAEFDCAINAVKRLSLSNRRWV